MHRLRYYIAARNNAKDETRFVGLNQEGDFIFVDHQGALRFNNYAEVCRFVDYVFKHWLDYKKGDRYMIFTEHSFEMAKEDWRRLEKEYGADSDRRDKRYERRQRD